MSRPLEQAALKVSYISVLGKPTLMTFTAPFDISPFFGRVNNRLFADTHLLV